ncbi:SDR family oxidoreductase [Agromyces archimandritae]|uniref:Peroxisomal trans-2-enoyl-CoA reductase n=1 Tax=Agromyces archimandritae TaxID=2781962 RepID=A0A975IPW2_9MICO|nr:SDR family oxidoreductase [Agromyces archimandritae]QTX06020.1 SDR family oxidoreductase [Agromyces archimandritae]
MSELLGSSPGSRVLRSDALSGKVVLVTGAGSGIGRAIALDAARAGASLVLAGRREEPLLATRDEAALVGADCLVVTADIREADQVTSMVDAALDRFGAVDVLVNNAGGQFMAPAEDITPKGWRAVHRLAVDGSWMVTREVATRSMIPRLSGVIFFIGFSPRRGIPQMVHATSARAALENLASGLALEWSQYGIRTLCVNPGTIDTEGLQQQYDESARREWAQGVPLGRLGTEWDVSALVTFLATPAASFITGTQIVVDGGGDAWGTGRPVPPLVEAPGENA